jgi:hypothetical protein
MYYIFIGNGINNEIFFFTVEDGTRILDKLGKHATTELFLQLKSWYFPFHSFIIFLTELSKLQVKLRVLNAKQHPQPPKNFLSVFTSTQMSKIESITKIMQKKLYSASIIQVAKG